MSAPKPTMGIGKNRRIVFAATMRGPNDDDEAKSALHVDALRVVVGAKTVACGQDETLVSVVCSSGAPDGAVCPCCDPNNRPVYAQVAKRSARPRACWGGGLKARLMSPHEGNDEAARFHRAYGRERHMAVRGAAREPGRTCRVGVLSG